MNLLSPHQLKQRSAGLCRWLLLAMAIVGMSKNTWAQFTYTFSASVPGWSNLTGGTNVLAGGSASAFLVDDAHSDAISLGFPFGYDGVIYTQVKVNSNGFISLETGDAPNNNTTANSNTSWQNTNFASPGTSLRPLIAPLWDDHAGAISGNASVATYATTGTAPNRVFTVEWRNWRWNRNATNAVISFQCRLYETTNVIEFLYNQNATGVNSGSASIGLLSGTAGNYISLNGTGGSPTAQTDPTAPTNTLSSKPASGQMYRFVPSCGTSTSITSITSNTPICAGSSLDLAATAAGTAPLSYTWSGTGTFSSNTVEDPSVTGAATGTYSLTVRNWCGTADTDNTSVTVVPQPTTAAAGSDQTLCISAGSTALAANAPTTGTGAWSILAGSPNTNTSQLSSTTSPTATFTPTTSGTYTLRWTISNSPCTASSDDVVITVRALPSTASVGGAQTICASGTTVALGGNTPSVGTGAWSIVSGGTGTFSNAASGSSTFTHTGGAGPVLLRWTISNSPCASSSATVTINITPTTSAANAGTDQTFCISSGSTTMAATAPTQGTGTWSILAGSPSTSTAQLSSTTSPTATFSPSGSGTYTLRWTVTNNPCASTTDDVVLNVRALPSTATVGGSQTICAAGTTAALGGNTPSSGSGSWSIVGGGSGTFSNATSGASTFTHTGGAGPVVLRWTISNSPCAATTADVSINITPATTLANAGPDQTICLSSGSTTLAANAPTQGTGAWSILAGSPNTSTAQLSSINSPTATFTPTAAGTYTLRWTISNNPCAASTNDVVITVNPFALPVSQTFNSTSTFTVPPGVTQISVQAWAGGGAGGGSTNAGSGFGAARGGAGGGGGAYVTKVLTVTPGSNLDVIVGAGGTGIAGSTGGNGGASTITGFESLIFAAGGSGGTGNTTGGSPAGGTGGTTAASQGDSELAGSSGSSGASGFAAGSGSGGNGANSGGAGGTGLGAFDGTSNGDAGAAPGGGGGGARTGNNAGNRAGGNGGAGRIIITYTPVPTLSASMSTICAGGSTTLTASGGGSYLWSPGGATTSSIVVSPSSTTTYSVTVTNTCPTVLTQQVNVVPQPNAGSNNTLVVCDIDAAVDMSTLLGAHDAGAWSGPSTVVADLYDPATMSPGNYVYTVAAAPCTNATATIVVTENTATARYADVDGDGFGDPSDLILSCSPIVGRVSNNLDCNDTQLQYADTDGDGFGAGSPVACGVANNADCNDAQLQYTDADGDGFGTGTPVACGVASNSDCNDAQLQYADTDGDGFGAGSPVACGVANNTDDCPSVPGLVGSTCDAQPGPGFALGQLNGSCNCIAVACTENVVLELRSDANSSQLGWEILAQNTNLVICSGGAPSEPFPNGITTPITPNCCLPVGCYRLRVLDAGGDGFVSGGITGGYQLRESGPAGRRIIDNMGNFTGGSTSALTTNYDNGAFCVPVGNDRPIFSSCDKQDWVNNKFIVATENPAVSAQHGVNNANSGYEFWFFDPNGSYSYRRFRSHATSDGFGEGATRACHFKINGWFNTITNPHIPAGVLLNVRIRGRVNGNNLPFGAACLFRIDPVRAACPLVKLQDNPLNTSDYSCGVMRVFGGSNSGANKLVANPPQFTPAVASNMVRYQFRFRIPGEYPNPGSCIVRPPQMSPTLHLNWTSGDKLKCNTQYEVDVRVSKDGGATWCVADGEPTCSSNPTSWGKVCMVNIGSSTFCPNNAQGGSSAFIAAPESNFTFYPNPNNGEAMFLSATGLDQDVMTLSVDVFDMTGKRVLARTLGIQDGLINTSVDLNTLQSGVYLVNLTAGARTYTERLVIQR